MTEAQQVGTYRVGLVFLAWKGFFPTQVKSFREALTELRYIEGHNLILTQIKGETYEELRNAVKANSKQQFDVVVATGGAETVLVRDLLNEFPIVFMPMSYPVEAGVVKSLAHPGTNITGITYLRDFEGDGKRLEMLKEVVPPMRRVVILFDGRNIKENPSGTLSLPEISKVAARLGLNLIEQPVQSVIDVERAVSVLPERPSHGLFVVCTPLFRNLKKAASIAIKKKFPSMACSRRHVAEGILLSYAPDMSLIGRRGAWYVDRILRGARPEDLPVENPRQFELTINLQTANSIGIKIPPEVLQRADRVIR
jgi:putative ABC transport system substrate-binding protein